MANKCGALLALTLSGAHAFEYSVKGSVGSWSKLGFNTQDVDQDKHQYPTESISTLTGGLSLNASILDGLNAVVSVYGGGAFYDSMRYRPKSGEKFSTSDNTKVPLQTGQEYIRDGYLVNNAHLTYKNDIFYIKAGRFKSGAVGYFYSNHAQGAEFAINAAGAKVWGFWSDKRAGASSSWMYDYGLINATSASLLGGGAEYLKNGIKGGIFAYYRSNYFTAPGVVLEFDSSELFGGDGLVSKTKFIALFPQAHSSKVDSTKRGRSTTRWGAVEKSSATYYLEQKFLLENYNFGAALYLNSGNPNEYIGTYGNPVIADIWTTSMYDIGNALSDIVGKNAVSPMLFGGAKFGNLSLNLLARYTKSDRSDEQSLGLLVDYKLREDVSIGGKLEYLNDTTKAGYAVGKNGVVNGTAKRTDDRSHAFFYIEHTF